MTHQQKYFEQLQTIFPSKLEMVKQLTKLLNLSTDAVYRRLRGATALTANEFIHLQQHFQLNYGNSRGNGMSQFNFAEQEICSASDYINHLERRMAQFQNLRNVRLMIANPGLPFFHEMMSPRLFAFKLYIYSSTSWDLTGWRDLRFSMDMFDYRLLERANAIGEFSYTVPGRELWSMGLLNATLDQIEFMQIADRFSDDNEALNLINDLSALVDHLEEMSRQGRKFSPGSDPQFGADFRPTQNELANNDDIIFVDSDQHSILFATYITPNFLQTSDPTICELTTTWFDSVEKLSTPLGANADKHRRWYFNRLRRQIQTVKERVKAQARIEF